MTSTARPYGGWTEQTHNSSRTQLRSPLFASNCPQDNDSNSSDCSALLLSLWMTFLPDSQFLFVQFLDAGRAGRPAAVGEGGRRRWSVGLGSGDELSES